MFNSLCNKKGITIIEVVLTLFLTMVASLIKTRVAGRD